MSLCAGEAAWCTDCGSPPSEGTPAAQESDDRGGGRRRRRCCFFVRARERRVCAAPRFCFAAFGCKKFDVPAHISQRFLPLLMPGRLARPRGVPWFLLLLCVCVRARAERRRKKNSKNLPVVPFALQNAAPLSHALPLRTHNYSDHTQQTNKQTNKPLSVFFFLLLLSDRKNE